MSTPETKASKWSFGAAFFSTFFGGILFLFKGEGFKLFLSFAIFVLFIGILELVKMLYSVDISDAYFFISLFGLFILNGYLFSAYFYYSYIEPSRGKITFFILAGGALVWVLSPVGQQGLLDLGIPFSLSFLPTFDDMSLTKYGVISGVVLLIYFVLSWNWTTDPENDFFMEGNVARRRALNVLVVFILSSTSYNYFYESNAEKALERHKITAETELANGNYKKAGEAFGYAAASAGATGDLDEMEKLIIALENAKKRGN